MAKLTLSDLGQLTPNTNTTINANHTLIEAAMEKTLSRDGTSPNEMQADLDMNSKRVYNLPAPASPNDAARYQDIANVSTVINSLTLDDTGLRNAYHFQSKSAFAASTFLALVTEVHINGFRYTYTASEPSHVAKAQNTSSGRWYVYAEPIFYQAATNHADICNGVVNDAITAAYTLNIPLELTSGTGTLSIDPNSSGGGTDSGRFAVISGATNWIKKCLISGAGDIVLSIGGTTAIPVEGQIVWGDINAPNVKLPPLTITMGSALSRTVTGVNYAAAKEGRVTHVSKSTSSGSGGTGYTGPTFAVSFTGGGGAGAAGTAYVTGGVIDAIVVTNEGAGYTSAPTVDLSAGGGGINAVFTAVVNTNIVEATITLGSDRPSNCAVGMPVGFDALWTGTSEDGGSLNGSCLIKSLPATATEIVVEFTSPRATVPVDVAVFTHPSGGTPAPLAYFPPCWLEVKGGYTGVTSGAEGFINATGVNVVKLDKVHARWSTQSQVTGAKAAQSWGHVGAIGGTIHNADRSIISNFPGNGFRLNGSDYYLNRIMVGGGICGDTAVTTQGSGGGQLVDSAVGSCKQQVLLVGRGNSMLASSTYVGAGTHGMNCFGFGDVTTCFIAGCTTGVDADYGGVIYGGASSLVQRCTTGVNWNNGGRIVLEYDDVIGSISNRGKYGDNVNVDARGGYWRDSEGLVTSRRYWTDDIHDSYGSSSPESVVTAGIGSIFRRSDGIRGSTLYVKQNGTGNTGWTPFPFVGNHTVATINALTATAGLIAFATNGRKNGEGAGAGTGVIAFADGTAWRACDTGATLAA